MRHKLTLFVLILALAVALVALLYPKPIAKDTYHITEENCQCFGHTYEDRFMIKTTTTYCIGVPYSCQDIEIRNVSCYKNGMIVSLQNTGHSFINFSMQEPRIWGTKPFQMIPIHSRDPREQVCYPGQSGRYKLIFPPRIIETDEQYPDIQDYPSYGANLVNFGPYEGITFSRGCRTFKDQLLEDDTTNVSCLP